MSTNEIQLPDKPKFRTLSTIANDILETPWFIKGQPKFDKDTGAMIIDFNNPKVIAVGVGNLTLRHMMTYESIYDESIETSVNKILYVFYALNKSINPEIDSHAVPFLEMDEYGNTVTPLGLMKGSFEKNIVEVCSFILSCYGRITGQKSNGEYQYDVFSQSDVVDTIRGNVFIIPFEDGMMPFMEIFERAGLWSPDDIKKSLKKTEELAPEEEDELGNSQ
jgi:hypothetical protein